jgi:biopolymer transport protein TolR
MPALVARHGSRRRTINEINMVPFIDVMLVLLIIFMVSAPLMTPGLVDLPSVGQARQAPDKVIEVVIDAGESLRLRVDSKGDGERLQLRSLATRVRQIQGGSANVPVVIAADRRVGLAVRTTGT